MLQIGDKIKYHDVSGEVISTMQDMVIVKLADGKEYPLPYDSITKDNASVVAPTEMSGIITALRPHLKNINFLNDLAKESLKAGISELSIANGVVKSFASKESLEEKLNRYKAEALAEAERKAKEEFEKENA